MPILPQDVYVGQQFAHWTAIGPAFLKKQDEYRKRYSVPCRCACGIERTIEAYNLTHDKSRSCGCAKRFGPIVPGQRFGRLTVLHPTGKHKNDRKVLVKCDCGTIKETRRYQLVDGSVVSCGCYRREKKSTTTHGFSHERLHSIWSHMRHRCSNKDFHGYGQRGITVCSEWQANYLPFREWAHSHGYKEGLSLDRINVDGNYEPSNCRWATHKEQANNTRKTVRVTCWGETKSLTGWTQDPRCQVHFETLKRRIHEGWEAEEAISLPPYGKLKHAK